MKKIIALVLALIPALIFAQEYDQIVDYKKIVEHPGKGTQWANENALIYEKTLWGDTWYNPAYWEVGVGVKGEWYTHKYFNINPPSADNGWTFELDIENLNNDPNKEYHAPNDSQRTIKGDNIRWGIGLAMIVEGDTVYVAFMLNRGKNGKGYYRVYDGNSTSDWKETSGVVYGPSTFLVSSDINETRISYINKNSWNGYFLMTFPKHCEEIIYIDLIVLPQSKLRVGDATLTYLKTLPPPKPTQQKTKSNPAKKPLTK